MDPKIGRNNRTNIGISSPWHPFSSQPVSVGPDRNHIWDWSRILILDQLVGRLILHRGWPSRISFRKSCEFWTAPKHSDSICINLTIIWLWNPCITSHFSSVWGLLDPWCVWCADFQVLYSKMYRCISWLPVQLRATASQKMHELFSRGFEFEKLLSMHLHFLSVLKEGSLSQFGTQNHRVDPCSYLNKSAWSINTDELKLPILGNTLLNCACSRPIHWAIGSMKFSKGYFGIKRPRPASCSAPGSKDFGNELKILPPLIPPPAMT